MKVSNVLGVFGILIFLFNSWAIHYFYTHKDEQPVKPRNVKFVTLCGFILTLWLIGLAFQRFFERDFPCMLELWMAVGGKHLD